MSGLAENDVAVLNYIFDPNITGNYDIHQPHEDEDEAQECEEDLSGEALEAKKLELAGVRAAEAGDLIRALELFDRAALLAGRRASVYNNRAQAHRLNGDQRSAMEDLEKALELSGSKGRVGRQALCQRGVIHRKLGFDEKARLDFKAAAILGSSFARKQLVEMNPYAAMCNQMMQQILLPKHEG